MNGSAGRKDGLLGTLVVSAVIAAASLISGMILARSLSPELRGVLATILLWPTMLGIFSDLGLGFAVSYYTAKEPGSSSALWTISLLYGFAAGSVFGAVGAWMLPHFLELSAANAFYLRLAMLIVPANLVANYASMLLLGSGWLREYNLIRAWANVSYALGILLLAALNRAGVHGYTLAYIAAQLSAVGLATALVLWRIQPRLAWSRPLLKPLFLYGAKTYVSSVVAQTNLRLDQMIMSAVTPFAQLGNYVVAVAMSSTIGPIYTTLAIVALPRVTRQADAQAGGMESTRYFRLGVLAGIPLAVLGVAAMPWLLPLLFGPQYTGAVLPAQILIVAAISQGLNIVLGNSLRGLGRPGLPAIAESAGVVITVSLLLVTLPIWGVIGAAATSLLAYSAVMVAQMAFINHFAHLTWRSWWLSNWRELWPNLSWTGIRRRLATKS